VHSIEKAPLPQGADFVVLGDVHVHKRPGLDEFFSRVNQHYLIGFWSAGGHDYVHAVLGKIVPPTMQPLFVWTSNRCIGRFDWERGSRYVIKDLHKLRRRGYDLTRIVIADDDWRTAQRNYGNLIPMRAFEGDQSDCELKHLADYLLSIKDITNFRSLEKRDWFTRRLNAS
jgi:TFIIF-interacting CTD phosphatase-like protein